MASVSSRAPGSRPLRCGLLVAGISLLLMAAASPALAGAWWRVSSRPAPTFLAEGQKATIVITATDVGDSGVDATSTPVRIEDTLPPGLEATAIKGQPATEKNEGQNMSCDLKSLTCTSQAELLPAFQSLEVTIAVNVRPGARSGESNKAVVEGGRVEHGEGEVGAEVPSATVAEPITVTGQPTPFGVEENGYSLVAENELGGLDEQAGSHPFQLTTKLNLNQTLESAKRGPEPSAPALPKELKFNLPPGLIGDPLAIKPCSDSDFSLYLTSGRNGCSPESAIGVAVVTINEPNIYGFVTSAVPLWNLEPAKGEPARFGFELLDVFIVLDTSVRTGGDYGVTVSVNNATEAAQLLGTEVTIWGVPGDARHDPSRGWLCVDGGAWAAGAPCEQQKQPQPSAFLTLPTSCTGTLRSTVEGTSWPVKSLASEPGEIFSLGGRSTEYTLPGSLHGCDRLPFSPSIGAQPVQEAEEGHAEAPTTAASTPTGLKVKVRVPQEATLAAGDLAEADVKSTSVTLPEEVLLNPAAADGLSACSEQQVGFEGAAGEDPLSPGAAQPPAFSTEPAACPDASKVGTVRIKTPLLSHELSGAVYLATPAPSGEPNKNPFNSLLALYIVAEDPASGIRVKLAGESTLNSATGRITSTFQDTPQVPFEELTLQLFGGPRGEVSTPPLCGQFQTEAAFAPWSGIGPVSTVSAGEEFAISSGVGGSGCANPQQFAPSLSAGSTNLQAGAFSPFQLDLTRHDSDQALNAITVHLPAGAAAMISSVQRCGEPQASQGTCGPESEIGHATASVGLGPDPYTVTGGRVYLTGPYEGAPFGLSIVTPAVAGPFDLGNVVVRSSVNVDPSTAAVTIKSVLPTIVQGVGMPSSGLPLQLQHIDVAVDRPNFEFNPTNCSPMSVDASLAGDRGGTAAVSSSFQVANCQSLPFKPGFSATTQAKTSKASGASLTVRVTSSAGQANIGKATVILPKVLPSRLTTIQKACVDRVFDANPAACPEGSLVGSATVRTPVLSNPLTGPAYLVSHGGAAFPDLEFVLQGEGITLVLDGQTAIRKGVTSSTFNSVPDAPVSSFETALPEGPHSALTAIGNLCTQKLTMPTTLTGQNGATLKQDTRIAVQGCAHAKKLTRAQKLSLALKACRAKHKRSRGKRVTCERQARRRYGAKAAHRAHGIHHHKARS